MIQQRESNTTIADGKHCPQPTWGYEPLVFQVFGCLCITLALGTVIINVVAIKWVVQAPKLKKPTRFLLASLAVCDISEGALVMPFRIAGMVSNALDIKYTTVCDIGNSFDMCVCILSIFIMCLLVLDRCVALSKPFKYHLICTTCKFCFSFIIMLIISFIASFVPIMKHWHIDGISIIYECILRITGSCQYLANRPYSLTFSLIAFVVPSIFMLICNIITMWAAYNRRRVFDNLLHITTKRGSLNRRHIGSKLARTVVNLSFWKIMCWTPFFTVNVLEPFLSHVVPRYIWTLVTWLGYAHSALNPYLYLKATSFIFPRFFNK